MHWPNMYWWKWTTFFLEVHNYIFNYLTQFSV
ncbi:hypothetical protein CCP4SC76_6310004 [Gammaproteobacteria bacterium]